ncbi:MAG: PilZ domain-containing protein [Spirochaetia bacterium]|jgi:hypothetical protein
MATIDAALQRGRKVFFLYPHSVLNEELLIEILSHEYEVYALHNHDAAVKVAAANPGSILFVNIDDTLKEHQWEAWIRRLISNPQTSSTKVGIVTYNPNEQLARKYLMDMMLPCGFIQLKQGLAEGKRIILKTLDANEARGRRRFVRAQCNDPKKASLNVTVKGKFITGAILDISVAGMTFHLDEPVVMKPETLLEDIQLRLKGTLCRVTGILAGAGGGQGHYLLMFANPVAEDIKEKVHRFIYSTLQEQIDDFIRGRRG